MDIRGIKLSGPWSWRIPCGWFANYSPNSRNGCRRDHLVSKLLAQQTN